ncbi:MAG TPA: VOC family protein [Microthrixaceae bacterium]|nr:VOC family protein [Microthrixaceae bacterium]HQF96224.1 VOC family protein [Microthrixaceae bacterium]
MTIRQQPAAGVPIWIDLMTSDRDASVAFYTELFGWTSDEPNPDFGGYSNFRLHGEEVAGLMTAEPGAPSDMWSVYLATPDAPATLEAARNAGASVMVDAMAVGDLGTMAVVVDPGGAVIGMWQPGEHRGGVVATTNAPCHFELHTTSYDAVLPFYRDVFGWTISTAADEPGFRYSTYDVADGENAGIMDASVFGEGASNCWSVYFAADDVAATLARAVELGGAVLHGPETTPYGVLATATDATGALFKLRGDA